MTTEIKNNDDAMTKETSSHEDSSSTTITSSQPSPTTIINKQKETPTSTLAPSAASPSATDTNSPLDHTHRKIVIFNVLKHLRPNQFSKDLDEWIAAAVPPSSDGSSPSPITVTKIKKPQGKPWAKITLASSEMVDQLMEGINSKRLTNGRGNVIYARRADDNDNDDKNDDTSNDRKRRRNDKDDDDGGSDDRRSRKIRSLGGDNDKPLTDDEVRDKVIPLWRMSYDKQLKTKWSEMVKKCALKIVKELERLFRTRRVEHKRNPKNVKLTPPYAYLSQNPAITISPIIPSPLVHEYRNKIEFTFGYHPTTKTPSVGFLAAGWHAGVSPPHPLSHIPTLACGIATLLETFLSTSPLPVYDCSTHTGIWRTCTIRLSRRTGDCAVLIVHAPPKGGKGETGGGYEEHWEGERDRLVTLLTAKDVPLVERDYPKVALEKDMLEKMSVIASDKVVTSDANPNSDPKIPSENIEPKRITSLLFQEFDGLSTPSPSHPTQLAFGKPHLEERLGDNTFRISPGAFFQVNTPAAEILYDVVVSALSPSKNFLLFDVCCGTGTIGLHCLKRGVAKRVVGVDVSEPAIADAKINATTNGFADETTARFVASRAESVMRREILDYETRSENETLDIVAVVDPARDGLHADVVKALRSCSRLETIVYVSCHPTGTLVRDVALLSAPTTKKYVGLPFKVVKATPVDMFPCTSHCEMVMVLERMTEDEFLGQTKKKDSQKSEKEDGKEMSDDVANANGSEGAEKMAGVEVTNEEEEKAVNQEKDATTTK